MKLKPEEAGLFYEMFLPLLDYVNENYHVTMETVHFTGERVDPGEAAGGGTIFMGTHLDY